MLEPVLARVDAWLRERAPDLVALARRIWEHPELGYQEHRAAAWLTEALEREGFAVERGLAGIATAFRATWRGGEGPAVAFLCEYDALAGLGHACGHNLIGVGGAAAALALRHAWPDLPGTLVVVGTPAEETEGAKVALADRGVFDGLAAALMWHPCDGPCLTYEPILACRSLRVRFRGRPAHAAAAPWDGVNALDAMVQFFVNVGLLRQQLPDGTRLHGVITRGGEAANVIPAETEADYLVRARTVGELERVYRRVQDCARAAALATGCAVDFEEGVTFKDMVENATLGAVFRRHLEPRGYAFREPGAPGGSSDIGNVSYVCPTIHPMVTIAPAGVGCHTAGFREAANSDAGYRAMLDATYALAATAAQLLADPELAAASRREWERRLAATPDGPGATR